MKIAISNILSAMAALCFVSSAIATETSLLRNNHGPTEIFAEKESTITASLTDVVNGSSGEIATSGQDDEPMLAVEVASDAGRGDGGKDVSIQLRGSVNSFLDESGGLGRCQMQYRAPCNFIKRCCSGMSCSAMSCYNSPRTEGELCSKKKPCGPDLFCFGTRITGVCKSRSVFGEYCDGFDNSCASAFSCAVSENKCYHKPRKSLEPCGLLDPCEEGFTCNEVCVLPCVSAAVDKTEHLNRLSDRLSFKKDKLNEAKQELEGAVTFYAAKLRDETQFIAEELVSYYSEKVEYCIDVDQDTSTQYADLCNPAKYDPGHFELNDDCICRSADVSRLNDKICNNDATRAEVIIHDDIVKINRLTEEIEDLEVEMENFMFKMKHDSQQRGLCNALFEVKQNLIKGVKIFVKAVGEFIEDSKCFIIKALFFLMSKVIDKLVTMVPYIGPAIAAMQSNPLCQGPVDIKKFKLFIPGGYVTGSMLSKALTIILWKIGDIDDSLYFFKEVAQMWSFVELMTGSMISGLCGNFGSAFIALIQPLVTCNVWDCGDNDPKCYCPYKFSACKDGEFLDATTMPSLPIAAELDYDMVNAMAEQTEIFTGKNLVTAADIVNEATSANLRGATELQFQPSLTAIDGISANESQRIQDDHEINIDRDIDLIPEYLEDGIGQTQCSAPGRKCCDSYPCCDGLSCSASKCGAADGSPCTSNDHCISNLCSGNICISYKTNGSTCSGDFNCFSDNCTDNKCVCGTDGSRCARAGLVGSNTCCDDVVFCNYVAGQCRMKKAKGSSCLRHEECQSNRCSWLKCRG